MSTFTIMQHTTWKFVKKYKHQNIFLRKSLQTFLKELHCHGKAIKQPLQWTPSQPTEAYILHVGNVATIQGSKGFYGI